MNAQLISLSSAHRSRHAALPPSFSSEEGEYSVTVTDVKFLGEDTDANGETWRLFDAWVFERFNGFALAYEEQAAAWMRVSSHGECIVELPVFDACSDDIARAGTDGQGLDALDEGHRDHTACLAFLKCIDTLELA